MIVFICTASVLVFLLGMLLLRREGLLKGGSRFAVCAFLMAAAVLVRVCLLNKESLDYLDFLTQWVSFFWENGGFKALGLSVGNYNPPYLYFLALFSYFDIPDLYLIKLLSVIFDVLLAWACMKLASLYVRGTRLIVCFFAVLFLPTVVINGAYWAQCDSIYAFFAVLSIYLVLSDRPCASMFCAAASLAFKLQAVFFLPVFFVMLIARRIKLRQLFIFPAAYVLYMLPAVLAGRPLWDTLTLYVSQAGTVGDAMNYNAPSFTSITDLSYDPEKWAGVLIIVAFVFVLLLFIAAAAYSDRLNDRLLLSFAVLFAIGIPFLLPHMHDRYFFVAGMLLTVLAVTEPVTLPAAVFAELASVHCYCAYFLRRYIVHPKYGGILMLAAFIIAALSLIINAEKNKKIEKST